FNVESPAELERLAAVATATGTTARVSLRVNPDVDARTHPYISTGLRDNKFGIPIDEAPALYEVASRMGGLEVAGVDCHIGSQLTDIAPLLAAMDRVLALVDTVAAAGIRLHHVNLGGGMGVRYRDESPPEPRRYAREILDRVASRDLELLLEPGRAVVAGAGVLLTRVEYLKRNGDRHFAVVDAAMNDLLRPALYSAWHDIVPVSLAAPTGVVRAEAEYDVVGPVCESSDFLGKGRRLALAAGDLLAVCTAGAYGAVMGSNYNARPRPPELLVDGTGTLVARRRETVADLFRLERRLPG
ncbi:MAG: diaminopimelate decarboxylase, partial [Ectothiorhodospiraceae bacterium]|nr:diaminopimelate decarboxylase [Ectothiorhodospiraceae bacterium]